MNLFGCAREKEVAELIRRGHWPQACAPELCAHVDECRACSDLVLVTHTFQVAHAQSVAMPRLEASGVLWWRAQLRRRNAAIERISKPILGAQLFALAVTIVVAGVVVAWQARHGHNVATWMGDLGRVLHFGALLPASVPDMDGGLWLIFPVLATVALVSGVVVYMASEKQ
jgi:hypothetical protein